jgi:organic radical activating enzyme
VTKTSAIVTISGGEIANKKQIAKLFHSLKDGRYMVEIATAKKRTSPQNRYYHGIVVPMVRKGIEEMGTEITLQETHEFLKARFNSVELVNKESGEVHQVPKSTAGLTTVEFNEFIEKIQRFAAEFLGIVIPDPGEVLTLNF